MDALYRFLMVQSLLEEKSRQQMDDTNRYETADTHTAIVNVDAAMSGETEHVFLRQLFSDSLAACCRTVALIYLRRQ